MRTADFDMAFATDGWHLPLNKASLSLRKGEHAIETTIPNYLTWYKIGGGAVM